jgi:hypothetical protein
MNWKKELSAGFGFAAAMLAIPFAARYAERQGWGNASELSERTLMVVLGAFLVSVGNDVPKRITRATCAHADPARVQAFHRFAGWTWVLTGLVFAVAWIVLPLEAAAASTLIVIPACVALILTRWIGLRAGRTT